MEKCRLCDYTTDKKANLRSHHKVRHIQGIPERKQSPRNPIFQCILCEYMGRTSLGFKKHMNTKHIDKEHTCLTDDCGFKSTNIMTFLEHSKKTRHEEYIDNDVDA